MSWFENWVAGLSKDISDLFNPNKLDADKIMVITPRNVACAHYLKSKLDNDPRVTKAIEYFGKIYCEVDIEDSQEVIDQYHGLTDDIEHFKIE